MVASAPPPPPTRAEPPAEPGARALGSEYARPRAPLTSEPPLADAEPLTSEPPLADTAHLTSESVAVAEPDPARP
ncbi:hypothetical protein [Streptomyces sp. NPDC005423]|uniref:hypothetical protein n=1 Tax=Streptomyces sp. NPDC005423 TaxID=3155343 RepID=UPI0033BA7127